MVGETVTFEPVNEPGLQVYEVAPVTDKVVLLPKQIVGDAADAVILGVGLTTTPKNRFEVQPKALTPVNVYAVVAAGLKTTAAVVKPPGLHV